MDAGGKGFFPKCVLSSWRTPSLLLSARVNPGSEEKYWTRGPSRFGILSVLCGTVTT